MTAFYDLSTVRQQPHQFNRDVSSGSFPEAWDQNRRPGRGSEGVKERYLYILAFKNEPLIEVGLSVDLHMRRIQSPRRFSTEGWKRPRGRKDRYAPPRRAGWGAREAAPLRA
jgi:hypothetical protein